MRALRVHAWGRPPVVEEVPDPEPVRGETLIRVSAASLGHLDRSVASGRFDAHPPLPYIPGTEAAGHVVGSERCQAGTAVWVRGGGLGTRRDGGCAELVCAPDDIVRECPDATDLDVAGCFFSPATAAYTALHSVGELTAGERLAVVGAAGSVGSLTIQLAAGAGAAEIVGVISRQESVPHVPAPATPVVGRGEELVTALREAGGGVDMLVDTVGGADLAERIQAVRPGGRLVVVGYTAGRTVTFDLVSLLLADVPLLPVNMLRREGEARAIAPQLLDRLSRGELQLTLARYDLGEAPRAWADLGDGRVRGRVVIKPHLGRAT